ncbi:MAG TPA: ATP-grasp fold amidoligase family protein [Verrucomicrobiae bacterium]|nr:ATP-grasp fold amidoligase family protein [Verrucomicrobiae bacterium]
MNRARLIFAAVNCCLYLRFFRLVMLSAWRIGYLPNIADPKTYAERMLWRKTIDRNPDFITFLDKLAAKTYIKKKCPEVSLAQVLWEGRSAAEIPDELLRGEVVVKANHGCGYNYRIREGVFDRTVLQRLTRKWLTRKYGRRYGEWGYNEIKPRLFVEEAIGDAAKDLVEFDIRAANGKAFLGCVTGKCKQPDEWFFFLDRSGRPALDLCDVDGQPPAPIPAHFNAMEAYFQAVRLADKLSVNVDYARFDFMWNGRRLFGSEITVYPASGVDDPRSTDCKRIILESWNLLDAHFLTRPQSGWKGIYAEALKRKITDRKLKAALENDFKTP